MTLGLPQPPHSKDDPYKVMRDIWGDYNHRQESEHELINRKTTWLLAGESLLFTAYGTSLGLVGAGKSSESADEFRDAVAVAGLSIAAAMLLALSTVMLSKGVSWWRYKRMYECQRRNPGLPAPVDRNPFRWGAFTLNTVVSLAADLAVPIVFVVTWSLLV